MLRANAAQELGFFDADLRACEDQDYWLRCAALGKRIGPNPEGLVIYRKHDGSLSDSRTQQLAYDAAIRFKVSMLLERKPDFPRAGKFYGWLAQAAGTLSCAWGLYTSTPQFALKLLDESARAMLRAAAFAARTPTEDSHLILAEEHFSALYLLMCHNFSDVPSGDMQKASGFLMHRYPHLVKMSPDALLEKQNHLFRKLCYDYERMRTTVKKAFLK